MAIKENFLMGYGYRITEEEKVSLETELMIKEIRDQHFLERETGPNWETSTTTSVRSSCSWNAHEFQNCHDQCNLSTPFFPFVSGGAYFDCPMFVQALQIFLEVEHWQFSDISVNQGRILSRPTVVSTTHHLGDGGVGLWSLGLTLWNWSSFISGTGGDVCWPLKRSKMNQVADQRVFCLVLIIFTKYFWFSAFQAYSSGIYLLTLTVLLHACVLIHFSRVQLFCNTMNCSPPDSLCPWDFLGQTY